MGVEPFDLDTPVWPGTPAPGDEAPASPGAAQEPWRTRRWPTWVVVAAALGSAAAAAIVVDLHAAAAQAAAVAARERAEAHLVVTDGTYLAGRVGADPDDPGGVRVAEALLSLQVVNAGPRTLTLLSVHGDGDAAPLGDVLGDGQPLPPATSTRVAVIGEFTCPRSRSVTVHRIVVRTRSADGRDHTVDAGHDAVSAWANGLQRACSQAFTTP